MAKLKIKLERLIPNTDWQTRHHLDLDNVERLIQAYKSGDPVPAILVKRRAGNRFEIFDGFHRYEAAKRLGFEELNAELYQGDDLSALGEGLSRNRQHGLQLTRDDMRKAARMLYIKRGKGKYKKGEAGTAGWISEILGVKRDTVYGWVRQGETERAKDRSRFKQHAVKVLKQAGDEGLKEAVLEQYGADALSQTYRPSVDWSFKATAKDAPGTPMLMLSDIHFGERVNGEEVFGLNAFDIEICKARIKHTVTTATGLLLRDFAKPDYEGIVLVLGGDIISGSIHEELMMTDESPPLVQCREASKMLADVVQFLAQNFKQVHVYCVAGNHGRTTRRSFTKFTAHHNLDWLCYQMLKDHCAALKNVEIDAPNARDLTFSVSGRRYRLSHGDQFKGGDALIGPLGPVVRGDARKRVAASLMPGQPEAYDTLLLGHWHTLIQLPRVIVNGAVKGYDEYALAQNFAFEPPQQALWTVHPKHGQTWYAPIICDPDYEAHTNG